VGRFGGTSIADNNSQDSLRKWDICGHFIFKDVKGREVWSETLEKRKCPWGINFERSITTRTYWEVQYFSIQSTTEVTNSFQHSNATGQKCSVMWFARSVACKVFWIPPTPNSPCVHLLFFKISLQVKIPSALILVTDRDFPEVKTLSSLSPVSENRHFHLIQNLLCCQSC